MSETVLISAEGYEQRRRELDALRTETRGELAGPLESDAGNGRVSVDAPVGRAVAGERAGSRVQVEAPGGPLALEIVAVRPGRRAEAA